MCSNPKKLNNCIFSTLHQFFQKAFLLLVMYNACKWYGNAKKDKIKAYLAYIDLHIYTLKYT